MRTLRYQTQSSSKQEESLLNASVVSIAAMISESDSLFEERRQSILVKNDLPIALLQVTGCGDMLKKAKEESPEQNLKLTPSLLAGCTVLYVCIYLLQTLD